MKSVTFLVAVALMQLFSFSAIKATKKPVMPEQMIVLLEQALEKNKFTEAAEWMVLFKIRVHLDAVCCNDPSASAAMDMLTIRQWGNPKFQELAKHISQKEYETIVQQKIAQVEQELNDGVLPSPEWIARYGMNQFVGSKGSLFVSTAECYRKRKEVLEQYKQTFAEKLEENSK